MSEPTHDQQQLSAIYQSLSNAGIGTTYHKRSLTEVSTDLAHWAQDGGLVAVREGKGKTLVGTDKAYVTAMLLARGLHIQGLSSLVVPLGRLVKWIQYDNDDLDRATTVRALFVTGFHHEGNSPLNDWQRNDVEELLLDRIDNGRSVFPQGARGVARGGWWTDTFVRQIGNASPEVTIK